MNSSKIGTVWGQKAKSISLSNSVPTFKQEMYLSILKQHQSEKLSKGSIQRLADGGWGAGHRRETLANFGDALPNNFCIARQFSLQMSVLVFAILLSSMQLGF